MVGRQFVAALEAAEPVANATNELVKSGALGALLVLVGAFAFYAVWKWNKANEARVEDQKETTKALMELTVSLRDTVRDMTEAIEKHQQSIERSTLATDRLDRTIDNVIRDAVRWGYRRPTPPAGMPKAGG